MRGSTSLSQVLRVDSLWYVGPSFAPPSVLTLIHAHTHTHTSQISVYTPKADRLSTTHGPCSEVQECVLSPIKQRPTFGAQISFPPKNCPLALSTSNKMLPIFLLRNASGPQSSEILSHIQPKFSGSTSQRASYARFSSCLFT